MTSLWIENYICSWLLLVWLSVHTRRNLARYYLPKQKRRKRETSKIIQNIQKQSLLLGRDAMACFNCVEPVDAVVHRWNRTHNVMSYVIFCDFVAVVCLSFILWRCGMHSRFRWINGLSHLHCWRRIQNKSRRFCHRKTKTKDSKVYYGDRPLCCFRRSSKPEE